MSEKVSEPVRGGGKAAGSAFVRKLQALFAWANNWRAVYPAVLDQRSPDIPTITIAQDFIEINGATVPGSARADGGFRLKIRFEIDGMDVSTAVDNGVLVISATSAGGSGS